MPLDPSQPILIVDDHPYVTETFCRVLQLEGFTVYSVLSPTRGLELASDKLPDAIILDLRMPILSGVRFLELLREQPAPAHTPVAIVTGDYFIDSGTTSQIEALGASVRFKPIWTDDLVTLTRGLMAA
jgi:CheY-like chemotaxis protein